jgi:hypothetical protein
MRDYFHHAENNLFSAGPRNSIPLKTLSFGAAELAPLNSRAIEFTSREATALLIAAKAAQVPFEGGRKIPRSFVFANKAWVVEKGCSQDIVRSNCAGLIPAQNPAEDQFVLSHDFVVWIEGRVGDATLSSFFTDASPNNLADT